MVSSFKMKLAEIQPSQLYINRLKLSQILDGYPESLLDPLPVKRLSGRVVFTDGHTRAFASALMGLSEIDVVWDEDELDWQAYEICVDWCIQADIHTVYDLVDRVIEDEQYGICWLQRCQEMHRQLALERLSPDESAAGSRSLQEINPLLSITGQNQPGGPISDDAGFS